MGLTYTLDQAAEGPPVYITAESAGVMTRDVVGRPVFDLGNPAELAIKDFAELRDSAAVAGWAAGYVCRRVGADPDDYFDTQQGRDSEPYQRWFRLGQDMVGQLAVGDADLQHQADIAAAMLLGGVDACLSIRDAVLEHYRLPTRLEEEVNAIISFSHREAVDALLALARWRPGALAWPADWSDADKGD